MHRGGVELGSQSGDQCGVANPVGPSIAAAQRNAPSSRRYSGTGGVRRSGQAQGARRYRREAPAWPVAVAGHGGVPATPLSRLRSLASENADGAVATSATSTRRPRRSAWPPLHETLARGRRGPAALPPGMLRDLRPSMLAATPPTITSLPRRPSPAPSLPCFEVHIGEIIATGAAPLHPGEPTPEVRSVFWRGEAIDQDAAKEAGYTAWDLKYGSGRRPAHALVSVTPAV